MKNDPVLPDYEDIGGRASPDTKQHVRSGKNPSPFASVEMPDLTLVSCDQIYVVSRHVRSGKGHVLFELPDYPEKRIVFDTEDVRQRLARIISDDDLRRYIL